MLQGPRSAWDTAEKVERSACYTVSENDCANAVAGPSKGAVGLPEDGEVEKQDGELGEGHGPEVEHFDGDVVLLDGSLMGL